MSVVLLGFIIFYWFFNVFFLLFFSSSSTDQLGMFGKKEFDLLAPYVDSFSLMTYDYSNPNR